MNLDHLLTETATVTTRTPASRDDYGNVLVTSGTRTTACWHEQTERDERNPVAVETWRAFFPPGDPLSRSDQVTIGGVAFEVIGGPWQPTNPRTEEQWQVEATLRRSDG